VSNVGSPFLDVILLSTIKTIVVKIVTEKLCLNVLFAGSAVLNITPKQVKNIVQSAV